MKVKIILLAIFNVNTFWIPITASVQSCDSNHSTEEERRQSALRMVKTYVEAAKDKDAALEESRLLLSGSFSNEMLDDVLSKAKEEATVKFRPDHWQYSDRFIHGMHKIVSDEDCMSREFDVQDEDYDFKEAVGVFQKCKLLVLRNVFDEDKLSGYKEKVTDFIHDLNRGWISPYGTTSHGEGFYLVDRGDDRWEINLPKALATEPDIVMNRNIMDVLQEDGVLGENVVLLANAALLSESGALGQDFHKDEGYLFETSLTSNGFGGHDIPAYAVSIMVPMLNMTRDHGPTEFCMGSSHLDAIESLLENIQVKDQSLIADGSLYRQYMEMFYTREENQTCPPKMWRTAVLNFGDIVLFDYQLAHQGGPNSSPKLRTLISLTYARPWYRDGNFQFALDNENDEEEEYDDDDNYGDVEEEEDDDNYGDVEEEEDDDVEEDNDDDLNFEDDKSDIYDSLVNNLRYGKPDDESDCEDDCDVENVRLENMKDFLGQYNDEDFNSFRKLSGHRMGRN